MDGIVKEAPPAKAFWMSWYNVLPLTEFELHRPWWISGERADGAETICAAIIAPDEEAAKSSILRSYDNPPASVEWRFCEERPDDWSPFNDRFPRASWMRWPDASPSTKGAASEAPAAEPKSSDTP